MIIRIPNLNPFRKKVYGYKRDHLILLGADGQVSDWHEKDKAVSELFKVAAPKATGDVDLREFCTDTNQQQLSACVGNSTADSYEILNAIDGLPRVELSRLFVYAMARILNGDLDKDEGTFIRSAFEAGNKFGICEETLWPYQTSKVFTSPSLMAQRRARGHKLHSYYRIKSNGAARVEDAIKALRAHKPIVFGTGIDDSFGKAKTDPVSIPKGKIIGGHAMVVVGYTGGNFIVKNSWGRSWGDHGYWYMTPEYFAWNETSDIWVPTLGSEFKIAA